MKEKIKQLYMESLDEIMLEDVDGAVENYKDEK